MERLESYNWPGNIRQLENVIKRAVLIALDGNISIGDIESILRQESVINNHLEAGQAAVATAPVPLPQLNASVAQSAHSTGVLSPSSRPYSWVREDEEQQLLEALQQTGGNKTRAAALLGMTARQFRYRLEKLALTDSR
jgi:Nif-specific regulatory protein